MSIPIFRPGHCNTCSLPVVGFRDALSAKEFTISGMCQTCQNSVFDVCEDCSCEWCECEPDEDGCV